MMQTDKTKVYICEDHKIVVHGIVSILSGTGQYDEIKSFSSGRELLRAIKVSEPALIILDLNLPDLNGLEVLKELRKEKDEILVLILTMHNDPFLVQQCKKAGANGFLLKDFGEEQLLKAVESINSDDFYTGPSVSIQNGDDLFTGTLKITGREKDIIRYTAQGKSSQEISELLYISPHTVNTHRRNIYKKLKMNNVKELIKFAYDNGLN